MAPSLNTRSYYSGNASWQTPRSFVLDFAAGFTLKAAIFLLILFGVRYYYYIYRRKETKMNDPVPLWTEKIPPLQPPPLPPTLAKLPPQYTRNPPGPHQATGPYIRFSNFPPPNIRRHSYPVPAPSENARADSPVTDEIRVREYTRRVSADCSGIEKMIHGRVTESGFRGGQGRGWRRNQWVITGGEGGRGGHAG